MSANPKPAGNRPSWLVPVIFLVGFVVVAFLSNHQNDTRTPEGHYIVADEESYRKDLSTAHDLSVEPLQHFQAGDPLTPQEINQIKTAAKCLDEANLFKPNEVAPFILSGKAHAALGENEIAIEKLRQGIANIGSNPTVSMEQAGINAHYEISRALFAQGKYEDSYKEADIAAKEFPTSPEYLTSRAKAALQINKTDEAKEDVRAAVALDPTYAPAKVLAKYLRVPLPKGSDSTSTHSP